MTICWEKVGHRSKSRNNYYVYLNDPCPYFKKKKDDQAAVSGQLTHALMNL